MRLEQLDQVLGKSLGLFGQIGATMERFPFEYLFAIGTGHAISEVQAHALCKSEPDLDLEDIVVPGRSMVFEAAFEDWESEVGSLEGQEGFAEVAEEFAAGFLQYIQVAGVINVIANGAFGIRHAVGAGEGG